MITFRVWKRRLLMIENISSLVSVIVGTYGLFGYPLSVVHVIIFLVGFFGMLLCIMGYLMLSVLEKVIINYVEESSIGC